MELIKKFRLSQMFNNCFLIKEKNKYILIDAPADIQKVIVFLESENINLDEVWLTHCHFDHVLGLNILKDKFPNLKVYISKEEMNGINNKEENLFEPFGIESDFKYCGEVFASEDLTKEYKDLKTFFITGHSLNSTSYYFPKENTIFTGDVLFRETIGRSDLIYGNGIKLIEGIKKHLFTLPDETEVYSGHGFVTSIGHEKENNRAING